MLINIFKVLKVKRYKGTKFVWVETDAPKNTTNNRFFVKDSIIWKEGNTIRRTCQQVFEEIDMPDTIYVRSMDLYRITHELV